MLETRYVFVDTQVYIASNFEYKSGRLQRFADLARGEKVLPVTTDLTVREILSNIQDRVGIATAAVKRLRDKGRILGTSSKPSFSNIFREYDENAVFTDLRKQLEGYHADAGFEILPIAPQILSNVLDLYFEKRPPFGSEKKKYEFPDALVLETLRTECLRRRIKLYVISGDTDVKSVCTPDSPFIFLENLEQLLELAANEDQELVDIAHEIIWEVVPEIDDHLARSFEKLGFYLKDRDGEVNWASLDRVTRHDFHILAVEGETASFGMTATIHFTAQLTFEEIGPPNYDSEDKVVYTWQNVGERIEREIDVSAHGSFSFNSEEPYEPILEDLFLESGWDIGVEVG